MKNDPSDILPAPRSMSTPRVYRAIQSTPWALLPSKMDEILAFLEAHAMGIRPPAACDQCDDPPTSRLQAASGSSAQRTGSVAVLRLVGTISNRANMLSEYSGGVSLQLASKDFATLVADESVSAIILDMDSPGGFVDGVPEFAAQVFQARDRKRVVAVANTLMASAAYWIGASASEVVASPSAYVGSIGVFMVHADESGMWNALGIDNTIISAGKYKMAGNSFQPLEDEIKDLLQARIDAVYGEFVAGVARGRGVTASDVRKGFGQGLVLGSKDAVKEKLVDRVATLDETITRLQSARGRTRTAQAMAASMFIT